MANYECVWRTNYFSVKDKDRFNRLVAAVKERCDNVYTQEKDSKYMIGGYGTPEFYDEYNIESPFENVFFEELQKCVADDDAIIYKEAGHEKLDYVLLKAWVITKDVLHQFDFDRTLIYGAAQCLENDDWETDMDY